MKKCCNFLNILLARAKKIEMTIINILFFRGNVTYFHWIQKISQESFVTGPMDLWTDAAFVLKAHLGFGGALDGIVKRS